MSEKIYTFPVDAQLDERLRAFESQLKEGEQIVSQTTVPLPNGKAKLIITTRESHSKNRNLLLEDYKK